MSAVSRRRFVLTSAAILGSSLLVPRRTAAAELKLVPRKLPFPPNDEFGNFEPTITSDGNTIYFARFANTGDKRVRGKGSDLFVTHRIHQSGEWPGTAGDWTPPERLPDTVNAVDAIDLEPRITPDGKTLYFMSTRAGGLGGYDIWMTNRQPNGEWSPAQNLGPNINSASHDHCLMPLGLPGQEDTAQFISMRPREPGGQPSNDIYVTKLENGVWQPARRYESTLLDSIKANCRLSTVTRDGLILGVITLHDLETFHRMVFVHYDASSGEWKGPVVEAPFNQPGVDGACPMFTADGEKMIWSAGYDRGPGPIATAYGTGGVYDLFWLKTSDVVAWYKAKAGLG
jgi:hypothetical protein